MNIKSKIIISFLIAFLLPFTATVLSALTDLSAISNLSEREYGTKLKISEFLTDPINIREKLSEKAYEEVCSSIKSNNDEFLDNNNLRDLNRDVKRYSSTIYVTLNMEDYYIGDQNPVSNIDDNNLNEIDFSKYSIESEGIGYKKPFSYRSTSFSTNDAICRVFIITDLTNFNNYWERFIKSTIRIYFIIMIISGIALIIWLIFAFMRPLEVLSNTVNKVLKGELKEPVFIPDSNDEIIRISQNIEDLRNKLNDAIEDRLQYEEDTRSMITSIAHDFRTPLTTIKGYAEGMMDGVAKTPEKKYQYLKTISIKSNELSYLIDELSTFQKLEGKNLIYNFKAINFSEYFDDCIEDISLELSINDMEIIYNNTINDDVRILADPEQLKRVITNIIGNSLKYKNKEKGIIKVDAIPLNSAPLVYRSMAEDVNHIEDKFILVSISDNGPGVPEKELPLIFTRFYRTDSSRNSSKPGSGLGLAIVSRIVNDHGGKIWAETNEDGGLKIYFTLKQKQ